MSNLAIVLSIVIAFLGGGLVVSEVLWRRIQRRTTALERKLEHDQDLDDLSNAA